ncbi:MAG TPA: carbamoyltransferase HypF [Anaerolineales bacterium]|nr:carbamoyltransferase HypF [Anaerolineales bacterium]
MAKHISVTGIVQGVGFRPFVYGLATELGLHGWVCNTSGGVEILVEGRSANLEKFIQSLTQKSPALAKIDMLRIEETPEQSFSSFEIRASAAIQGNYQPISADMAICPDCERELFDPDDRRYLYPFINCTNCGPRFTIIKDIPYDRPNTTMADFPICAKCLSEYNDPLNRRFHAQPVACPECGPFVELRQTRSQASKPDSLISSIECRIFAILRARRLLREGYIVAIKGLGGFHLACDASNAAAVKELRRRKGRSGKPFALMAANIKVIETICVVSDEERQFLTRREKPIILLKKRTPANLQPFRVSEGVAPSLDTLGIMLPYTPLHHLLLNQTDPVLACESTPSILVMTSGNFSEEPIVTDNEEALQKLSALADAFLLHNRDIYVRCDDSVLQVDDHAPVYLRRSRGYAPYPIRLPSESKPILAVGGELKNTFCLARDRYAFLSQYMGDMENAQACEAFEQDVRHFSRLFRVQPEILAHDLHPDYFTTRYAKRSGTRQIGVQHHHAHISSCMADNELENRRLIGLAFDGTGYGTDGAIWGGEILLASYEHFQRFAHLEYLPLPGGDSAIHHPWRIAAGYAHTLGLEVDDLPFLQGVDKPDIRIVRQQADKRLNAPPTSSMGRLFDAVASLIGIRNDVTYEAQAAIELEVLSNPFLSQAKVYPWSLEETTDGFVIGLRDLLHSVISDARRELSPGLVGANFHKTLAQVSIEICMLARDKTGLNEVALSGGVWQNQILLHLVRDGLKNHGFSVFFHRGTPANDSGLALGQAVIANAIASSRD